MNDINAELSTSHEVKVCICYMLSKLDRPVTEKQLYEIVLNSEIINYFNYTEALDSLLKNGSVSKNETDGETYIILEEKGQMGSDYFNEYIPYYFRKRILRSAFAFFAKIKRESEADVTVSDIPGGCEVNCTVRDGSSELMKISLYAPDPDQAAVLKEKILLNPAEFYSNVISAALNNKEEQFELKK